ncbi:MAG: hypothetical protein HW383_829 [Candidatus Magasanikbacteria bacterium]|nr:hypothetical protein [Candidatus Magasanikbacteria bacterium]
MCFSATASFVAGTALTAVGVVTIKKAKRKSELPFAMIPLLFGLQQLTEGLVWLSFRFPAPLLNAVTTNVYSLFAFMLWPIFMPFAVRSLETVPWRKKLLFFFQLIGLAVGAYFLFFHLQSPATSQIINKSIVYSAPHFYYLLAIVFYFSATCISTLFSSHKLVNLLGVLVIISAITTYRFYTVSFVSVWCFFAAILSFIIFLFFIGKNFSWKWKLFS